MTLEQALAKPANNLTIVRMLAAVFVLLSHSFVANGVVRDEPLSRLTGGHVDLATLGVTFFFTISGLLVTKSFCERHSVLRFLMSRGLRIIPGLGVALLITACLVGAFATTLPLGEYF